MKKEPFEHFPTVDRLHTDVLQEKYGTIRPDIIEHNEERRIIDMLDKENVSRTRAITLYPQWTDRDKLRDVDEKIKNGKLIGEAFREEGYKIRKNVIDVFTVELSESMRKKFNTEDIHAKARTSEFYAKKDNNEPLIYGFVTEIYHPDFRPAVVNEVDMSQISANTYSLENRGISRDEIWNKIEGKNSYSNDDARLREAQKESLPRVMENRRYIQKYLDELDGK